MDGQGQGQTEKTGIMLNSKIVAAAGGRKDKQGQAVDRAKWPAGGGVKMTTKEKKKKKKKRYVWWTKGGDEDGVKMVAAGDMARGMFARMRLLLCCAHTHTHRHEHF